MGEFSPPEGIHHHIDFYLRASLPNLSHYRMAPAEHVELHRYITNLFSKGFVHQSTSRVQLLLVLRLRMMVLGVCLWIVMLLRKLLVSTAF